MAEEKTIAELATELKTATDKVLAVKDTTDAEMKRLGDSSKETKAAADKALVELEAVRQEWTKAQARIAELEQKGARRPGEGVTERKSIGRHFTESEAVKGMKQEAGKRYAVEIETKDITSGPTTAGTGVSPSTSLVVADRQPGVIALPMRPLRMRDLVPVGNTTSSSIEYVVQTSRTMNAAFVAETLLKPQSDFATDLKSVPVRTVAHWFRASLQIMDDAPMLRSMIDAEAEYGLDFVEDVQILYGNGSGVNLFGIIPQAQAFAPAASMPANATKIDRIRYALLQATLSLYPADGIVLNDTDWADIETTKDTQGRYIIGNPQGSISPTLWGKPVVTSLTMTPGTFLTGAFRLGCQLFERQAINIVLSTEDQDNFVKNMCTIRAERREALVVQRPTAFVTGPLAAAA